MTFVVFQVIRRSTLRVPVGTITAPDQRTADQAARRFSVLPFEARPESETSEGDLNEAMARQKRAAAVARGTRWAGDG